MYTCIYIVYPSYHATHTTKAEQNNLFVYIYVYKCQYISIHMYIRSPVYAIG